MRVPKSVDALENLGRVRLSQSFFMRDFLYSEISNFYGVPNIPENPDLAIQNGKRLCEELLNPCRLRLAASQFARHTDHQPLMRSGTKKGTIAGQMKVMQHPISGISRIKMGSMVQWPA